MKIFTADSSKCLPVVPEADTHRHKESTLHTGQHLGEPVYHLSMKFRQGEAWDSRGMSQGGHKGMVIWQSSDIIGVTSINLCYHWVHGRKCKGCHLISSPLSTIVSGLLKDCSPFPLLEAPRLVLFWFQVQRWNLSLQGNSHSFLNLQARQLRWLYGIIKTVVFTERLKFKL